MNQKPIPRKWIFLIFLAVITVSACNLFSNLLNPVDEVVSEIEDIAEEVDIENIEELGENIGTMVPELPSDFDDLGDLGNLDDLQATMEAVQDDFDFGEAPSDIPIVDAEIENFFASEAFVSYITPMDFNDVLDFYLEEMPNNDWEPQENVTVQSEDAAVLQYTKQGQDVIVTISKNPVDESTVVLITIEPK